MRMTRRPGIGGTPAPPASERRGAGAPPRRPSGGPGATAALGRLGRRGRALLALAALALLLAWLLPRLADPYERRFYWAQGAPTARERQLADRLVRDPALRREWGADQVLAGGGWPAGTDLFDLVTHAEFAEDEMRGRYGVPFEAAEGHTSSPLMGGELTYSYTLECRGGPHEGELFGFSYRIKNGEPPETRDTYGYQLVAWDVRNDLSHAISDALDRHPGAQALYSIGDVGGTLTWKDTDDPEADLARVKPLLITHVDVFVGPDSRIGRAEYEALKRDVVAAAKGEGTGISYEMVKLNALPSEMTEAGFSLHAGYVARRQMTTGADPGICSWHITGSVDGQGYEAGGKIEDE